MTQPRTPRTDDTLERTRYFPEQILSPSDLAQDRTYLLHKLRRHNRLLHGCGIVLGLTVENVPGKGTAGTEERRVFDAFEKRHGRLPPDVRSCDATWLIVQPGYAITPLGDEIYLPHPVFLNTSEELNDSLVAIPSECSSHTSPRKVDRQNKTWYLIVEACESELRPVRAANTRCGDHPEQFEFSRIRDTLRFRLQLDKPSPPYGADNDVNNRLNGHSERDWVCLGTVTFSNEKDPLISDLHREQLHTLEARAVATDTHQPAEVLSQLLSGDPATDHVQDAFRTIDSQKQKLVKGLRMCLRPAGLEQLFKGSPPGAALRKVCASQLMYGEPNEQLDRFFQRLDMNVSRLLEHDRILYFIGVQKGSPNDNEKRIGHLLEKAWQAAAVTSHLVRQWPS